MRKIGDDTVGGIVDLTTGAVLRVTSDSDIRWADLTPAYLDDEDFVSKAERHGQEVFVHEQSR